jgi:hypothetical protein
MEAISDFPARAMPLRPASGVCSGPWPQPALAEAQLGVQSRPSGSVIRRMSDDIPWSFAPGGGSDNASLDLHVSQDDHRAGKQCYLGMSAQKRTRPLPSWQCQSMSRTSRRRSNVLQ